MVGYWERVSAEEAQGAVQEVRALHERGVRGVPLLQGHEEVRRSGEDEADLHQQAVLGRE